MTARIYTCQVGDVVLHGGKRVQVSEVIEDGRESKETKEPTKHKRVPSAVRATITACSILPDGQVLTRSPRYVGQDWRHTR